MALGQEGINSPWFWVCAEKCQAWQIAGVVMRVNFWHLPTRMASSRCIMWVGACRFIFLYNKCNFSTQRGCVLKGVPTYREVLMTENFIYHFQMLSKRYKPMCIGASGSELDKFTSWEKKKKKADRKEFPNILVSFERGWFQTCNLRNVWDVYSCPATPAEQFVLFLIHSEAFLSTSGLPSGQPCKQERTFLVTCWVLEGEAGKES